MPPQVPDKEMDNENDAHGQQRLYPVHPKGHVQPPARHDFRGTEREGHDRTGEADDTFPRKELNKQILPTARISAYQAASEK